MGVPRTSTYTIIANVKTAVEKALLDCFRYRVIEVEIMFKGELRKAYRPVFQVRDRSLIPLMEADGWLAEYAP